MVHSLSLGRRSWFRALDPNNRPTITGYDSLRCIELNGNGIELKVSVAQEWIRACHAELEPWRPALRWVRLSYCD